MEFDSWTGFCALLTQGEISADDRHLAQALVRRGWRVDGVDWCSDQVSWPDYDVVLVRSTWNYCERLGEFLAVLRAIDEQNVLLENSVQLVQWNSDKRYLADLEQRGVPVVPTVFVPVDELSELSARLAAASVHDGPIVVKPGVGANASGVVRLERGEGCEIQRVEESARTLAHKSPGASLLVQPLVESVLSEGEYSLMYFAGEFSHAVVKRPRAGEFRVQESCGGSVEATSADAAMRAAAAAALATLDEEPLYARVDLVRAPHGGFWLVELELIEPSLFFALGKGSAERFAAVVEAHAA